MGGISVPNGASPRIPGEAVVLAAGAGTRLRLGNDAPPKPLTPVLGRTLIERSIETFSSAGVRRLTVVVGCDRDLIAAAVEELACTYEIEIDVVENPHWERGNGSSVLAAADRVDGAFYLAMGDHLFDQGILSALADADDGAELSLAVDHAWRAVPDLDEATKVLLDGRTILDIGKELSEFDAVDTGIFLCRSGIFDALDCARAAQVHSLSGAVKVLARRGEAVTAPVSGRFWQDVDTPADLALAERRLRQRDAFAPARAAWSSPARVPGVHGA
ncbi:MAG: NTP transferase domain-containing protein [Dehalococcoidia bacterium]